MSVVGHVVRPAILRVRVSGTLTIQDIITMSGGFIDSEHATRPSAMLHLQVGNHESEKIRFYRKDWGTPLSQLGVEASRLWKVDVDDGIL